MASAAKAPNNPRSAHDHRHPAAARVWDPEPEWVPPTPNTIELGGGIAGGLFGAVTAPLLAGPILGALSALGQEDRTLTVHAGEKGDPGWFGPSSVAWRVHADPSLLIAGIAEHLQASAAVGAFLVGIALSGPAGRGAREVLGPLRDLFAAMFFVFFAFSNCFVFCVARH